MKKEHVVTRNERWNPDIDLSLAGMLLTISAVTRRLAKLVLDASTNEHQGGKRYE